MGRENPDWLPAGWRVEVKVRSCGRKDKYYVNPSNSLKFNSKPEVLRYLETSAEISKPKERSKIDVEKTVADKLPPGWIKETRITKKGGRTRKDPYYIEPDTGRHFRSMQEVYRHLETKDSVKSKAKEENSGDIIADSGDHSQSSSAEAKDQRSIDKKPDKIITRQESKKSESELARVSKTAATKKMDMQVVKENKLDKREEEEDSLVVELSDKLQEVNEVEPNEDKLTENKELSGNKQDQSVDGAQTLKSGSEAGAGKIIYTTETTCSKQQEEKVNSVKQNENVTRVNNKRKKSNSKWTSDLPRRTSKRLSRPSVDESSEIKPTDKARTEATLPSEAEDSTSKNIVKNSSNEGPTECRTENLTNDKQKEDKSIPIDRKEDEGQEKNLDSSLENLLMDPCIEFAIKTLTGAIPIEDVNKLVESPNETSGSGPVLGSGDIWADPCFEFAVKTLTGEVPVEDCSQFQISFQQPLSSVGSGGFNNITVQNTNYSFDAVKQSHSREEGVRDPSLPHAINGISQKFMDTSLHHGMEWQRRNCM